jgi:hypothetical protein
MVGEAFCPDYAEEVAARVWLSLLRHDMRQLRRFDPARGRLANYLALRAGQELGLLHRQERARPAERAACPLQENDRPVRAEAVSGAEWEEFCATLSAQERRLVGLLLGEGDEGAEPLSDVNRRKLTQRVRSKLARQPPQANAARAQ